MALGSVYMALIARITRTSVLEVLSEDYIRTAHAKGLTAFRVLIGHALKNAGVPIVTVIGVGLGLLIGGVVITESVFGIPGIGRLTVDAILARDYPVIQGVILVFSGIYVLVNLLVDCPMPSSIRASATDRLGQPQAPDDRGDPGSRQRSPTASFSAPTSSISCGEIRR